MKKVLKYISIIMISLTIIFGVLVPAKADSGWDTSYDSGGSWDSGGSYDYDYSSSSSSSSSGSASLETIIASIVFLILLNIFILKGTKTKYRKQDDYYNEISPEEFNNIIKDISMEDMRKKVFEVYEQLQYAWSNFDYDTIKKYTTDELYNMYSSQLETLQIKAEQNVMKEIINEEVKITKVDITNGITTVEANLKVNCYDYVINQKTNKVLRGNANNKLHLEYIITLVKDNSTNSITTCPGCGAEVNITTSKVCEYCRATLVQNSSDYVMSKKTIICQQEL